MDKREIVQDVKAVLQAFTQLVGHIGEKHADHTCCMRVVQEHLPRARVSERLNDYLKGELDG